MPCIINIETSTNVCSVSVSVNGKTVYIEEDTKGPSHAVLLGVFADNAIRFIRKEGIKPDAIAVSSGPGSYTGLRIGVSEAKGLCYGLNIPLIAINTPQIMASKVAESHLVDKDTLLCPMIDARRMEVYSAVYDNQLNLLREIEAEIIDENSYLDFLAQNRIAFFGNGSDKCRNSIKHPNALFLENIYPSASDMVVLAEKAFAEKLFVDVAYFEPFYLKEFVATTPKNKVL